MVIARALALGFVVQFALFMYLPHDLPLTVVYVRVDGTDPSAEYMQHIIDEVEAAFNYWKNLGKPLRYPQLYTAVLHIEPHDVVRWGTWATEPHTLYIVPNLHNAWGWPHTAVVPDFLSGGRLAPIIAHEFGHSVFGLQDTYGTGLEPSVCNQV